MHAPWVADSVRGLGLLSNKECRLTAPGRGQPGDCGRVAPAGPGSYYRRVYRASSVWVTGHGGAQSRQQRLLSAGITSDLLRGAGVAWRSGRVGVDHVAANETGQTRRGDSQSVDALAAVEHGDQLVQSPGCVLAGTGTGGVQLQAGNRSRCSWVIDNRVHRSATSLAARRLRQASA